MENINKGFAIISNAMWQANAKAETHTITRLLKGLETEFSTFEERDVDQVDRLLENISYCVELLKIINAE